MGAANPGLVDRLVRASSRACRGMPDARDTAGTRRTSRVPGMWRRSESVKDKNCQRHALAPSHGSIVQRRLWRGDRRQVCGEIPSANLNAGGPKDKHDGGAGCMDEALDWRSMKRSCVRFINVVMDCDDYFTPPVA